MTELDDDAVGFAAIEREFVRRFVADFDWVGFDSPSPRNALGVPLADARVGLVSTAGAHLPDDRPLSAAGEARPVPIDAAVRLTHVGYDTARAETDPDTVWPTRTLARLADEGFVGAVAPVAVSSMGFVPEGRRLLDRAAPTAVACLRDQEVDLALLVPA